MSQRALWSKRWPLLFLLSRQGEERIFKSRAGYLDPRNLKVQAQQSTQDTLRVVRLDHHCFAVSLYVNDAFYVSDYSRGELGDTANLFACGAGLDLGGSPFGDEGTVVDYSHTICESVGLFQIVRG